MPKVSVIIPTHNRAELLRGAIQSVLDQTYRDFEIIVVDDASTDHTPEVVRNFADERIRYVRNATNRGEGGARNVGLERARGEFIALLDDDDEWLPEKLELQVKVLESSTLQVGAVYTAVSTVDTVTGKSWESAFAARRGNVVEALLANNWITPSSMLLRKECFQKAGRFEEGMRFGADYDMWLRVARHFHFECIDKPLVRYRVHGGNVTANPRTVIEGLENQLIKYAQLWEANGKARSRRLLVLGALYVHGGDSRKGRKAFWEAARSDPLELRCYCYLVLSLFGTTVFRAVTAAKDALFYRLRAKWFSLPDA
jgi:glycosyltransferase involved in cell wall biosynthesis